MSNNPNISSLDGSSEFPPELVTSTGSTLEMAWNKPEPMPFDSILGPIPDVKIEAPLGTETIYNISSDPTALDINSLLQEVQYLRNDKVRMESEIKKLQETIKLLEVEIHRLRQNTQQQQQQPPRYNVRNDDYIQLLNDDQYPFPRYTVLEGTVRPYPVIIIRYPGPKEHLVVKAEPPPGSRFTIENHMAFFKAKDQTFIEHRQVGDIILFDDMHILGVGNAEGERIQIDFSLYSLEGNNPVLLAQKRSPPIIVFNHSQYLPAPSITKLLPNYAFVGQRPKVEVFGPLFLRKNNILECQIIEEDGREVVLLKGNAILRKRNCFHSFSFVAPDHPPGRVIVRARYKDREFGEGKPFEYWTPTSQLPNQNRQTVPTDDVSAKSIQPEFGFNNIYGSFSNQGFNNPAYSILMFTFHGNTHGLTMALEKQDSRKILNQRDEHGFTPLHWAVFRGFGDCVRIMVEKGADVNMPNGRGETSLHIAAGTGYVDIVKQLLTYGAKADYQNHTGMTPLHIAALTGHDFVIKELLDFVEDAEELLLKRDREGLTALHIAIMASQPASFNMLVHQMITYHVPLDISDKNGMTPLHWAVSLDHTPFVLTLVYYMHQYSHSFGGINARDCSKETPLHYAVRNQNQEIVKILLQNCADPNITNAEKETPLFVAVREKSDSLVHLLLDHGADPSIVNQKGQSVFESNEETASVVTITQSNVTMPQTLPLASLTPAKSQKQEPSSKIQTKENISGSNNPPVTVTARGVTSKPETAKQTTSEVVSQVPIKKMTTPQPGLTEIATTTSTPTPQMGTSPTTQPLKFPLTESVLDDIMRQLSIDVASSPSKTTSKKDELFNQLKKVMQECEKEYQTKIAYAEHKVKQLEDEVIKLKNMVSLRMEGSKQTQQQ